MTTEVVTDASAAKRSTSGDGATWGLASMALGATALLSAAATLVFNAVLFLWHSVPPRDFPTLSAMVNAVLCILVMLGLSCCGVVFGMKGRGIDRDRSAPSPLATAGILLAASATVAWITVGINLISILSQF